MRIFEVESAGPGRLAVVTRPSSEALTQDVRDFAAAGFTHLVSLLGPAEAADLGLESEPVACAAAGVAFVSHPIPDFSLPEPFAFRTLLFELHDLLRGGAAIGAHCRGSVGRSPLLVASLLVLDGVSPAAAWDRLSEARGVRVPDTDAQRDWIWTLSARAAQGSVS
jgi:protein-tyrosine phosphatase